MVRVLFIDDDPWAQATVSMILAERYGLFLLEDIMSCPSPPPVIMMKVRYSDNRVERYEVR